MVVVKERKYYLIYRVPIVKMPIREIGTGKIIRYTFDYTYSKVKFYDYYKPEAEWLYSMDGVRIGKKIKVAYLVKMLCLN